MEKLLATIGLIAGVLYLFACVTQKGFSGLYETGSPTSVVTRVTETLNGTVARSTSLPHIPGMPHADYY